MSRPTCTATEVPDSKLLKKLVAQARPPSRKRKGTIMTTITTQELKQKKQENPDVLLINTLDQEHFAKTRIPDAINVPQSEPNFVEQVKQKAGTKDAEIVVYCASSECDSSTKAAQKLEQAGFSHVYDFEAGAKGWSS